MQPLRRRHLILVPFPERNHHLFFPRKDGSLDVSRKLSTHPSPKPTISPSFHLEQNLGLGEGRWAVSQKRIIVNSLPIPYNYFTRN